MAPNNSGRTALGISQWAPGGYLSLRVGVMQFIQRLSLKFRSRRDAARSIAEAGRYLMGHVGITGHVECLLSCDAHDRHGFVLRLNTFQRIPHSAREEIQHYFRRKLTQLGELQGAPLLLWIQDADDQWYASQANRSVSSGRVASVVAAANIEQASPDLPAAQLDDLRRDVRRRLIERRNVRNSDYAPLGPTPLTDLGALSPH